MLEQNQIQNQNLNELEPKNEKEKSEAKNTVDEKITEESSNHIPELEVTLSFEKIELIKKILTDIQNNITRVICLLGGEVKDQELISSENFSTEIENLNAQVKLVNKQFDQVVPLDSVAPVRGSETSVGDIISSSSDTSVGNARIIEGVFNGQNMIGSDGKEYLVPPNYASKSKLVEGDLLKLTIDSLGKFIYKQIGPIERNRIIGTLAQNPHDPNSFVVVHKNRRWRVLTASVTYFKGSPGDEAVILIPKNAPSKWAAVENIIKKDSE